MVMRVTCIKIKQRYWTLRQQDNTGWYSICWGSVSKDFTKK